MQLRNCRSVLPVVHPTVNDGVVHRVGHGEPIDEQVDVLNVLRVGDLGHVRGDDEVRVEGQPADRENKHHHDHHLHNLQLKQRNIFKCMTIQKDAVQIYFICNY